MPGTLFVVSTPIGNLGDLTHRAVEVLRTVDVVACEDTRTTRVLLDHYDVRTRTVALHAHSTEAEVEGLVERLDAGASIALVSDAGTPLLSDPGGTLVAEAVARGHAVVPIPGASALLAALVGSGVDVTRFTFLGFLPRSEAQQLELLAPLRTFPGAVALYESPRRVGETLALLARALGGGRGAVVARELTKRFESFERGTLAALEARDWAETRGEIVVVVAPPSGEDLAATAAGTVDMAAEIRRLRAEGVGAAEISRILAAAHGRTRREVYREVLEVLKGTEPA
jgi:16S rRNA (cytidine1402-2'-O)-methyltransferase